MQENLAQEPVWSVSAVNRAVRETVEGAFMPFWVGGEVGTITAARSGHVYFQLKDEKSQLRTTWFGGAAECRKLGVETGSLVEVWGSLSVYEPRGEYQFLVRKLRLAGTGDLQRRFEALKRKLEAEGLFAPERKKTIPSFPRTIGVVTSPTGAAIRDFLQILRRRFSAVRVLIYPALVQGSQAARQLAQGVEFFNRTKAVDVIVVTRGGGSMEDLWPFNEEILARSVAGSAIPVISAVGHEIDFTICDFAADLRVPTPSAAAELVIGRQEDLLLRLERAQKDLLNAVRLPLADAKARWERLSGSRVFHEPRRIAESRRQYLDELDFRLSGALREDLRRRQNRLIRSETALQTLNPLRQLERGYAMVVDPESRRVVTSSREPAGKDLEICFADGKLAVKTQ